MDLEEIEDRWKYAEYAMAYAQAWAGKKLSLSKERSRALFQLSLASHEIDKFGSSDYQAIIKDLTGISSSDQVIEGYDPDVVVEPIQEGEIQEMTGRVDNSLSLIRKSASKLQASVSDLKEVKEFQPKNWIEEKRKKFSRLKERIDNAGTEFLKREFRGICEDFESVYTFPTDQVSKTHQKIREAKKFMKKARTQFQGALTLMEELSRSNPMIKQLHEDFIEEKNPPGVAFQVKTGVDDVLEEIGDYENRVNSLEDSFQVSNDLTRDFPADFRSRFREALESENRDLADEILSEAMDSASQAFEDFEESIKNGLDRADSAYYHLDNMVERQTRKPKPNWKKGYKEYPDPSEDYDEEPEKETAEKYVIRPENGTVGGLEKVIKNASSHLDLFENMGGEFEKKREDLKKFEIEDDLREKLRGETSYKIPENLSREKSYGLSPPEPLRSDPGFSVYHEVEIEDVKYEREDPAGRLCGSAPTPIYLWFIGVTLYWAQWDVKIKLKEPLLEEIFDYKNQTILRPFSKESRIYVHKPLPFRQEFQKSEFGFRLIVVSLRPFSISSG